MAMVKGRGSLIQKASRAGLTPHARVRCSSGRAKPPGIPAWPEYRVYSLAFRSGTNSLGCFL